MPDKPTKDQQKLETQWKESLANLEERRERDRRRASGKTISNFKKAPKSGQTLGAYLTPEILARRQELTLKGRVKLVLDYGYQGEKKEYSLGELNQMAKALDRADNKFQSNVKGVPARELIRRALPRDKQRVKDIAAATLYSFEGNTLNFRVTASGETPNAPSHYKVRIRLEEWNEKAMRTEGANWRSKSQQACFGNVSIDCNCGGYQFPYRYLATIGGFAITPEHVFPKIKNPRLKGCCCKHILKTLTIMQGPIVVNRVAKEMQNWSRSHFPPGDQEKYLRADQVKRMEAAGAIEYDRALKSFKKSLAAFKKKSEEEAAKAALRELKPKKSAKGKVKMEELDDKTKVKAAETVIQKLKADIRTNHIGMLKTLHQIGNLDEDTLTKYAKNTNTDKELLKQIAKEEGLL